MFYLKSKKKGFTLVELLTVLAIITMLVGLLVPSLNVVRRIAKEAKQRSELTTIDTALTAFRNDYGDYPPSDGWDYDTGTPGGEPLPYCGAQKLCEALLGWDLMGFHPDSAWRWDGLDIAGGPLTYDPQRVRGDVTLYERKGRYLELATVNAFRLGISGPGQQDGLFDIPATYPLFPAAHTFVLCDVFGFKKITIAGKVYNAGSPVLYYRANTSSRTIEDGADLSGLIYEATDNQTVVALRDVDEDGDIGDHPLGQPADDYQYFYDYITDARVPGVWPYRPHSYILITAGADGLYGTGDDICNFGN